MDEDLIQQARDRAGELPAGDAGLALACAARMEELERERTRIAREIAVTRQRLAALLGQSA